MPGKPRIEGDHKDRPYVRRGHNSLLPGSPIRFFDNRISFTTGVY